jgi:hypothetical protein
MAKHIPVNRGMFSVFYRLIMALSFRIKRDFLDKKKAA